MKVIYQNETKRIPDISTYNALCAAIKNAFEMNNQTVTSKLKLYYMDEDGDVVSISCQGDLDEAKEAMPSAMRLVVASNSNEAR